MKFGLVFARGWLLALVLVSEGNVLGAPSPAPGGRRPGGTDGQGPVSPPVPSAGEFDQPGEKALAIRPWSRSGQADQSEWEPSKGEKDGSRTGKSRSPLDADETGPPVAGGTEPVVPGSREQRHRRRRNQGEFTRFPARKPRPITPREGEAPEADEDDQEPKSESEESGRD